MVMWLVWLPDYLTQGRKWFEDDDVAYSRDTVLRITGSPTVTVIGGVRPTTVMCDFTATSGAVSTKPLG